MSSSGATGSVSDMPTTRRKRTTGFPVVSLAEAAEILKTAGKYGFEHSIAAFATYMGHSSTNSGAFRQRIAAFRDWRLITGRGESVAFTDAARVIALPPDEDAERLAMREAFANCTVFSKLYDGSAKGTSLQRQGLGNRAVHDFGVAPGSITKFVDSFVDSAVAADLARVEDDGDVVLLVPTEDDEDHAGHRPAPTPTGAGQARTPAFAGTPVVRQAWNIDGGTIAFEIRRERPLPSAAFAAVGEAVANLERLAETLSSAAPPHSAEHESSAE